MLLGDAKDERFYCYLSSCQLGLNPFLGKSGRDTHIARDFIFIEVFHFDSNIQQLLT